MKLHYWCLVIVFAASRVSNASSSEPQVGYVACDRTGEQSVSMLLDICKNLPAGTISCGQALSVVRRHGDWMEISLPNGPARYLQTSRVSRDAEKFVPFDKDSGIEDDGPVDCPVRPVAPRSLWPYAIYAPDPEYTPEARRARIEGVVKLSLVVGTDGLPHDITIDQRLGNGLDEKAVEAVQQWKFRQAMKDGQAIEKKIWITVTFHLNY